MMTRARVKLPDMGIPRETLERELNAMQADRVRRHWSLAFRGPPDVQDVGRLAYNQFLSDNGLFSLRTE